MNIDNFASVYKGLFMLALAYKYMDLWDVTSKLLQ